jgi:hypothetical protein
MAEETGRLCMYCPKNPFSVGSPLVVAMFDPAKQCKLYNATKDSCPLQAIPAEKIVNERLQWIQKIRLMIEEIEADMRKKGIVRNNLSTENLEEELRKINKNIEWVHASVDRRGNLMHVEIVVWSSELLNLLTIARKAVALIDNWMVKNRILYKGTSGEVKIEGKPNDAQHRINIWFLKGQKVKTICCATDMPVSCTKERDGYFWCSRHYPWGSDD